MRLLLVEDDRHIRTALARVLFAHGDDVTKATDAHEAMVLIAARPFDLLIVDINLPDATGWDVLRQREGTPNRSTPAVVMSAVPPSVSRIREFRPMGVLLKPFPIDALRLMVHQAAERLTGSVAVAKEA
jgi:DNA-binding response OmpR family regulator